MSVGTEFLSTERDYQRIVKTVVVAAGATSAEDSSGMGMEVRDIYFVVPVVDGVGGTAELILRNEDGVDLYRSGELAENTTHALRMTRLLVGLITVRVETSAGMSATRDFVVYLYGR